MTPCLAQPSDDAAISYFMNDGVRHVYHIQQFLCHVSYTLSSIYSHNNVFVYRMAVRVCLQMRSC